jgi:hypothetical protein
MNTRYQIFVSSTYSDLQKEREHVINELTRIGYIAVGMEQFPATDEEQLEYIQKIIDDFGLLRCDNPWKIRLFGE